MSSGGEFGFLEAAEVVPVASALRFLVAVVAVVVGAIVRYDNDDVEINLMRSCKERSKERILRTTGVFRIYIKAL